MKKLSLLLLISLTVWLGAYASGSLPYYHAQYLAERGIIVSHEDDPEDYRFNDSITRAEVVGIALKTADVTLPNEYLCKGYFNDVRKNDWICRAVEIAGDSGVVSRANASFRYSAPITRAEVLAIIMQASKITIQKNNISPFAFTDIPKTSWQYDLVGTALTLGIVTEPACPAADPDSGLDPRSCGGVIFGTFKPNQIATRAEVFGFAKNIIEQQTPAGFVTYKNPKYGFEISYPEAIFDAPNIEANENNTTLKFLNKKHDYYYGELGFPELISADGTLSTRLIVFIMNDKTVNSTSYAEMSDEYTPFTTPLGVGYFEKEKNGWNYIHGIELQNNAIISSVSMNPSKQVNECEMNGICTIDTAPSTEEQALFKKILRTLKPLK